MAARESVGLLMEENGVALTDFSIAL